MPSIVAARDVSFELPNGRVLFQGLCFSLDARLTALVGPNGIGKTCLAKLVAGELEPSEGDLRRRGEIVYVPQRLAPPAVSVAEFLADGGYRPSALGESLLRGLDRALPCSSLSGGQWMRARLARAVGDRFLILDEPTNDLDREGRAALLEFLRGHERGALLISHDRECLALCDEVLELSSGGLAKHGGGWAEYESARARERAGLSSALDLAKRERDAARAERAEQSERQSKRNRRGGDAASRGGLPKILLGARKRRAQATTGAIDAATLARADDAVRDAHAAFAELKIDPVMYANIAGREIPAQKLVAEARGFNVRFGDWLYARDLDFAWRGGVRLALKGGNGSGKSTLLKAIMGERFETRGELRRGQLVTLYVDQRCATLNDAKTVLENAQDVSNATESELRGGLAKFLFMKESVRQKAGTLSGGERLRATLARGLLAAEKPELLILDEPTNNLDLANVEFLERLAREFRGALIVISHDEAFLRNCGVEKDYDLYGIGPR